MVPSGRYRFTGREFESITGFQYHRARYYDPATGRWTSQDPLGLLADVNPYRYAGNSPVNAVDPFGMQSSTERNLDRLFGSRRYLEEQERNWERREENKELVKRRWDRAVDTLEHAARVVWNHTGELAYDVVRHSIDDPRNILELAAAWREGRAHGNAIVGNAFTFGQIDPLNRYVERIVAENNYQLAQAASVIGREAAITALTMGLGNSVQGLRVARSAGNLGRFGMVGLRGGQAALLGLQGREAWLAGESFGQAYLDIRQGNSGMAALNLTLGGLGVFGAGSGIRPTASFVEDVGRSLGGAFRRTGQLAGQLRRGFTQRARAAIDKLRSVRLGHAAARFASIPKHLRRIFQEGRGVPTTPGRKVLRFFFDTRQTFRQSADFLGNQAQRTGGRLLGRFLRRLGPVDLDHMFIQQWMVRAVSRRFPRFGEHLRRFANGGWNLVPLPRWVNQVILNKRVLGLPVFRITTTAGTAYVTYKTVSFFTDQMAKAYAELLKWHELVENK
ncbi:MAG: hypothetical protein KatS3mg105_4686 [Gemmatales bacterium]|nr:MAG: hypothetical protein KatS3mg105_4686 [Gemmatales bacterium]